MANQNSNLLPPKLRSGYVYDKILRAVADSTSDDDRFPDGLAAQGRVIFTPAHALLQLTEDGRGVKVTKEPVVCRISDGGYDPAETGLLVDQSGSVGGVWLPVGRWTATYKFSDGMSSVPPVTFDVTEEHTKEAPADLGLLAEVPQTPRTKFVVNEQVYLDTQAARDEAVPAASAATAAASTATAAASEATAAAASTPHTYVSNVEPVSPKLGDIWFDTSGA